MKDRIGFFIYLLNREDAYAPHKRLPEDAMLRNGAVICVHVRGRSLELSYLMMVLDMRKDLSHLPLVSTTINLRSVLELNRRQAW